MLSSKTCYGLLLKLLRNAGSPRKDLFGSSLAPLWYLIGSPESGEQRGESGEAKRRTRGGNEEPMGWHQGAIRENIFQKF
jgi:hypothetical protein